MVRRHHGRAAFHLEHTSPQPSPLAYVIAQLPNLSKRGSSDSSSTSSNTCSKNDKSVQCATPNESNNITLPIVLGIVIPLVAAILVFIYLHRKHVKKLRREDANDPHKSLDFGIESSNAAASGRKNGRDNVSETTMTGLGMEKPSRRGHGMSVDLGSPYLLPPGLQNSRESLHSLSRTIQGGDDRYQPATSLVSSTSTSPHAYPRSAGGADDTSSYAESGFSGRGNRNDSMNQNLLANAQGMSRTIPPQRSPSNDQANAPETRTVEAQSPVMDNSTPANGTTTGLSPAAPLDSRGSYLGKDNAEIRKSNNYLGHLIHSRESSADHTSQHHNPAARSAPLDSSPSVIPSPAVNPKFPTTSPTTEASRPPRLQSLNASTEPLYDGEFTDDASDYGESFKVTPPSSIQVRKVPQNSAAAKTAQVAKLGGEDYTLDEGDEYTLGGVNAPPMGPDVRRLSRGVRPLPPDDSTDNPEQRANRIRSFYKEYFDESKPVPASAPTDTYVEDYDHGYLGDGAIFNPASGQFVVAQPQFTEPFARRAMTPPPRAPPRFQGPARHHATLSGSHFGPPGSRAFSSASGYMDPSRRGPPKAALPPPGPLRVLPTPHLLMEDSFALPIDFAPPTSYKDRQAGRPESPRGGMRPYSPMLPAHLPLASSFDDLSVMPSPHLLRKSSTFTALDFAPPPRFRSNDTASDAGSIRSNRSAMSAQQLQSIRAGAYRVSRIPKEVVGTKDEINDSLKPQWGMRPH